LKSIFSSSDLVKEGHVWQIGNGNQVRIWKDKGLPRPMTFMMQSQPNLLDENAKVCELIDPNIKWWRTSLLETMFMKEKVELI
jgi:hypothetical protein